MPTPTDSARPALPVDYEPFFVGTFAGGGVRGYEYPALLRALARATHVPAQQLFHYLIGTSTGGICALLLAAGYSPEEIAQFYKKDAKSIFDYTIGRKLKSIGTAFGSRYSNSELEKRLKQYLDLPMSAAKTPVCVTTFDKKSAQLLFIRSYDPFWADLPMYKAAVATAAAPVFFNHYGIEHHGFSNHCIDAGGGVNNPSREALDEIEEYFAVPRSSVHMVNFECSRVDHVLWPNGGLIPWLKYLFEYAQTISMRTATYACSRRLKARFVQLAPKLAKPVPMDSAADKDLNFIEAETLRYIEENPETIRMAAELLSRPVKPAKDA